MPRTPCKNFPTGKTLPTRPSRSAGMNHITTVMIGLAATLVTVMPASVTAQQPSYQAPRVRHLDDPFGRDAPPPGGIAADIRRDPIPAFRDFPPKWTAAQGRKCEPQLDTQTGRTMAWKCRMADGSIQIID
jgi:hypothetical protein